MSGFPHEKLEVYQRSLAFAGFAEPVLARWEPKHAVRDQLARATESIAVNLAQGASTDADTRLGFLDYALGSALECAACLDVARSKELLDPSQLSTGKQLLVEIAKMLVGLRKFRAGRVREDERRYATRARVEEEPTELFAHERLDVYRVALQFVSWFHQQAGRNSVPTRYFRLIDTAATGLALNIAEGNGRFAKLDHRRFLEIAEVSAVKAATFMDLAVVAGTFPAAEAEPGKQLLQRARAMLVGLQSYCRQEAERPTKVAMKATTKVQGCNDQGRDEDDDEGTRLQRPRSR
jgi:four helix bundle protein